MKRKFDVEMIAHVQVEIEDFDNIVGRVLENRDGWRDHFYPLNGLEGVLEMFAYNAVANGETDVKRLDGWADIDRDTATMQVTEAFIDRYTEEP